ncbi:MAG: hypothetical protein K940chlam9_01685 [Chlamydiae bacterium]|nr:hypothetical protein [Chlamydiota bacterium]
MPNLNQVDSSNQGCLSKMPCSPKVVKISVVTAVAIAGIALGATGLLNHFGVINIHGLNSVSTIVMAGAGGAILLGDVGLAVFFALRKSSSSEDKSPELGGDGLSLKVVTWNLGTIGDRAIAQVFAKTGKHPESLSQGEQGVAEAEEIYKESRTVAFSEMRQEMVLGQFSAMGDLDIIFVQEAYDFEQLDTLLEGNYGISEKAQTANTRVLWNQDRFTFLGVINLGDDTGVQLRENETGLIINAISGHICGFGLNQSSGGEEEIPMIREDMAGGNGQLTRIVSQCQAQAAHMTILGMDVNCPRLEEGDDVYSQIDPSHRAIHFERHNILDENRFSTLQPLYPTNLNRHYGEIPLDYVYWQSASDLDMSQQAAAKPQGLEWENSPSDHMPVINTFVIQNAQ